MDPAISSLLVIISCIRAVDSTAGHSKDPQQAGVAHATVTLSNGDRQADRTVSTNNQGGYAFTDLAPGTFTLQVVAGGFKTSATQVVFASGRSATQDISMKLADTEQTVTVTAGSQGDAASGYRVDTLAQLGTLGSNRIVDTPYSISEVPSPLIQNMQAKNLRDVINYMPLLSFQEQQGPEIIRPETRGMQGSVVQNTRMNGMAYTVTGPNPMEDLQEIEAVNGLAGSMYGPANPSGMFNFITKRPTDETSREINVDYDNKSIFTGDADIAGRVGPHKFLGYRVNALVADGTANVAGSHLGRSLAAADFDIHPSENSVIELDYLNYHVIQRGYPGWFTYGTTSGKFVELVNAPILRERGMASPMLE